jgi:hypothetical protein
MLTVGDAFPQFNLTGVVSLDLKNAFKDFNNASDKG